MKKCLIKTYLYNEIKMQPFRRIQQYEKVSMRYYQGTVGSQYALYLQYDILMKIKTLICLLHTGISKPKRTVCTFSQETVNYGSFGEGNRI